MPASTDEHATAPAGQSGGRIADKTKNSENSDANEVDHSEVAGNNPSADRALAYFRRGWQPVVIAPGTKGPTGKDWPRTRYSEEDIPAAFPPGANVGILLGEASGGLVDIDIDNPLLLSVLHRYVPDTPARFGRKSSPNSHWLYRADPPPTTSRFEDPTKGGLGLIAEIRADSGKQTVFPGSTHITGEAIEWVSVGDSEPSNVTAQDLQSGVAKACALLLLRHHWPDTGLRHAAAMAFAGAMLRADVNASDVEEWLEFVWETAQRDEVANVVSSTAKALDEDKRVTGWPALQELISPEVLRTFALWLGVRRVWGSHPQLTDFGNSDRFVNKHGEDLRYVETQKSWYEWDDRRFRIDQQRHVRERGKETIRHITDEMKDETDEERQKAIFKHARNSQSNRALEAMLTLSQTVPSVAATIDGFDREPMLFNVQNGTIDLATGALRPASRKDMLTRLAPIIHDPDATCPIWEAFLLSAMKGDADLAAYLQRLVGYMLTGDITEKMLPVLWDRGTPARPRSRRPSWHCSGQITQGPRRNPLSRRNTGLATTRSRTIWRRCGAHASWWFRKRRRAWFSTRAGSRR